MSSNDVAIRVENLSKSYHLYDTPRERLKQFVVPRVMRMMGLTPKNYFREFWALRNISLEVKKGESVAIIGRNGSGKSTLLQIVAGVINPTHGYVESDGRVVALLELGSGFNMDFTGRENVYMKASILGVPPGEIKRRFDEIADFADIGDFVERPVNTYSTGMLMKLAFAASIFVDPDILIIDEALAVGDAAFQIKCLDRLKELAENGVTLLFVSHDMGMVKNFCHNALYIRGGETRAFGTPDEMAELYFMDIRDEQRLHSAAKGRVGPKDFIGQGRGMAFGTEEGRITNACFAESGATMAIFRIGENVEIRVEATYHVGVKNPAVCLLVQDHRMINIGGRFFPITSDHVVDGEWVNASMNLRFPVKLSSGRYNITVRLENRQTASAFTVIDKQVGAMTFEVIDQNHEFLGPVNLDIHQA